MEIRVFRHRNHSRVGGCPMATRGTPDLNYSKSQNNNLVKANRASCKAQILWVPNFCWILSLRKRPPIMLSSSRWMICKPRRRSSRPRGTSSNRTPSLAMLHQSRNGAANQPKGSRLARTILRLWHRPRHLEMISLRPRITSFHWISRSLLLMQIGSRRCHRARMFCIISIRSKMHMLLPSIPWALR